MPKKQDYTNESISALKGADRVRKRPGVIFGSDGLEGCQHAFFEILSNSIDEAREGHGKTIRVRVFPDDSIEVEDFGRGCPVDWNENEQRYNWELVFCELYAGGKYHIGDENYEFSLGLNGLGSCATQYSSAYMDVQVRRDGFLYTLRFERGDIVGEMRKEPYSGRKTGSLHRWKPDLEVFTDIAIPSEYYFDVLRRQAVVNPGVVFQLDYKGEKREYLYENGLPDYLREVVAEQSGLLAAGAEDGEEEPDSGEGAKPFLTRPVLWQTERRGRDREDKDEYKVRLSAAFCFSQTAALQEHYHNSSFLEHGGSPVAATKSAFVSAIDAWLKANNKYNKGESKPSWQDISDCLVLVSSNFSTQTSYENQTKKAITNKFVAEAMTEFLKSRLEVYFIENKEDAERIAAQVLVNKRSREMAEKTRLGLKKKMSGGLDIATRVQKFHDCRTRDLERRELYIVEGDSAMGACIQARDSDFQAIIPVRGKILNCLKSEYAKIFKNEIITDLIKVLGCGAEVKSKAAGGVSSFDLGSLRWKRVIICTDADVDGFHIRTMILAMLYRLTPQLIEEGFVYIAESPLFELTYRDKTAFAYTDAEKERVLEEWGRPKGARVSRSKGLGENEPDMMWMTTMNPASRRLLQVVPEEAARTAAVFDLLLGDNLQGRKDFITDHGAEYLELADIS
ncbi:MAG: toprim domain-containing protein [Oscillospiraceae bacterium]|nr:toprim domain-containing protein [Oscillospiraceae bacterium]